MKFGVRQFGGDDLERRLNALSASDKRAVLLAALKVAAEPMRDRMQTLAPRGPDAPHLADNIGVSVVREKDSDAVAVAIGPTKDFFYGWFLEHGTVHMAARPFVRPAFDATAQASLDVLSQEIWNGLKTLHPESFSSGTTTRTL